MNEQDRPNKVTADVDVISVNYVSNDVPKLEHKQWFSRADVAKMTEIPDTTLKRYLKGEVSEFPDDIKQIPGRQKEYTLNFIKSRLESFGKKAELSLLEQRLHSGVSNDTPPKAQTDEATKLLVDTLIKQLDQKDEQIVRMADSLNAAHVLNRELQTNIIPLLESKIKNQKPWWSNIFKPRQNQ